MTKSDFERIMTFERAGALTEEEQQKLINSKITPFEILLRFIGLKK